ncbi:MAG: FAD-dependent monooxygenase [Chloroflexi bacterium]|nr:FAD-dependent monooxygenase [Chloroflexota bacterium]MCI0579838.1 FAD-dependent monooxygenase [Chloroflexota bacterium]MCI0648022.1 FAD-dependent monooxygenase [Chloroflexota bacterium]
MSDLASRFAALSPEQQALFEKLLKKDDRFSALKQQTADSSEPDWYDVVVIGGGLAGMCMALHLKKARPATSVLLVEKYPLPLPESNMKVGESSLEIGSHYFDTILAMKHHLDTEQLPKMGLRFFFTAGDNSDIAQRVELGSFQFLWHPSYQLNRARFENALASAAVKHGAAIQDRCRVREVTFGPDYHTVVLELDGQSKTIHTRWIVDASGRVAFLRRKLDLVEKVGHDANSVWFHVAEDVDIGTWSNDPVWLGRLKSGLRRLSTNHLLGRGYWVWLIPLSTGSHSIGIVADAKLHPLEKMNKFEDAMVWLRQHEPQCAQEIDKRLDLIEDFRVQRHFAHGCKQAYSTDRWCMIGEAAVFTDPLYSLGSDFIGMGNTLVVDLIGRELAGEDIMERVEFYNWFFLKTWFQIGLSLYEGNYPFMGNTQVMLAKVLWDSGIYWGYFGALFFHNKLCDLEFMRSIKDQIQRVMDLTIRLQAFFREWAGLAPQEWHNKTIDWSSVDFLYRFHWTMGQGLDDEALKAHLTGNLALLERVIAEMFYKAAHFLPPELRGREINPLALSLDPERWAKEGLFLDTPLPPLPAELAVDLNKIWFEPGSAAGVMSNGRPLATEDLGGAVRRLATAEDTKEIVEPVRAY